MPDDDYVLVAGALKDPSNEVHSKAENVSLRMNKMNLFLMFERIELAHTRQANIRNIFQSPFALMFMHYVIYFDNKANFPH